MSGSRRAPTQVERAFTPFNGARDKRILLDSIRLDGAETGVRQRVSDLFISVATLPQRHSFLRPTHRTTTPDGGSEHPEAPVNVVVRPRANDMILCGHLTAAVPVQYVAVRGIHIEEEPPAGTQTPEDRTERCAQFVDREQVIETVEQAERRVEALTHPELPHICLNEWNTVSIRPRIPQHRP